MTCEASCRPAAKTRQTSANLSKCVASFRTMFQLKFPILSPPFCLFLLSFHFFPTTAVRFVTHDGFGLISPLNDYMHLFRHDFFQLASCTEPQTMSRQSN